MRKKKIKKSEQVREVIRKALNQILDEEYENIVKQLKDGNVELSNKIKTDDFSNNSLLENEDFYY